MPSPRRPRLVPARPARGGTQAGSAPRPSRWLAGFLVLVLAFALGTALGPWAGSAHAHDRLQSLLNQDFELVAGVTNLDVSVELTFHEGPSFAERRILDTNRDGRVEPSEVRQYLRERLPEFEDGLHLELQTSPDQPALALPLTLLHQPELDLRGQPAVGLASHTLRLHWFARTPAPIPAGSRLILTSELWTHLPSTRSVRASGSPAPGLAIRVADPPGEPAAPTVTPPALPGRSRSRLEPMVFLCPRAR